MTALQTQAATEVARPLKVLVPLIQKDLEQGKEASERAGEPYYRAAGGKLVEAKSQMKKGEFGPWIKRNFDLSYTHAERYMKYWRATTDTHFHRYEENDLPNFSQFMREEGGDPGYGKVIRKQAWHEPVKEIMGRVDLETLNRQRNEMKSRAEEREAQRKLALQLIDIGFKALAAKLHPDKGGSRAAMARLNEVRARLKQHA